MSQEELDKAHHLIGMGQAITALRCLAACLARSIDEEEPLTGDEVEWLIMCIQEKLKDHHAALSELIT